MGTEALTTSAKVVVTETVTEKITKQSISQHEEQIKIVDDTRKFALEAVKQKTEALEQLKEKQELKRSKIENEDVFITALRMAINNDGEIDKKELKHLLRLELKSSRQSKNSDDFWQPFRLEIDFGNWFSLPRMRFFSTSSDNNYFEKSNLDQGLREAFKLAALDGVINSNEIEELKLHL
jgi:hypothetical protein